MTITTEEAEALAVECSRHTELQESSGGTWWEVPEVCERAANTIRTLAAERDQLHRDLKDQECANEMLRRFVDEQRVSRVAVEARAERAEAEAERLREALADLLEAHESGWIAGEDWGAAKRARTALEGGKDADQQI